MNKISILGKLEKTKLNYEITDCQYLDDKDIFLAVDGKIPNNSYLKKLKKLYIEMGEKFLSKITDFITIYLYDKNKDILILARDRIGLKQIYYHYDKNTIYFGLDIINLLKKYHLKKNINIDSLSMYFRFYFVAPPNTIFNDIYKLEIGDYLIYKNNKIEVKNYYNIIDKYNKISKHATNDFSNHKRVLKTKLCKYIKDNVINEKNIGIYLSSGIDSSLVAAICSKYSKKKINTFSIGFHDEKHNEASSSKKIANFLQTNHHEIYVDEENILETIKKIPEYYTEPFADASEFACILLNEFAKENNIKIAITGDGADKLFCGLTIYDTLYKIQKVYKLFNPLNINLNNRFIRKNKKLTYLYANHPNKYKSQCDILYKENQFKGLFKDTGSKRYELEDKILTNNWQIKRMIMDLVTTTPERENNKINNSSYRNNINIISPYLSTEIIEYSFAISHDLKYHDKCKKYILKEILYDYIPSSFFNSRKKGFSIPVKRWLMTYLNQDLKKYATKEYLDKQKIFDYQVINSLIEKIEDDDLTNTLWCFYMFQVWYDKHINNK